MLRLPPGSVVALGGTPLVIPTGSTIEITGEGDGATLDAEELRDGLLKLGKEVTLEEAEAMVDEADEDGNGTLELDEFTDAFKKMGGDLPEDDLERIFLDADVDNSGGNDVCDGTGDAERNRERADEGGAYAGRDNVSVQDDEEEDEGEGK